LTNRLWNRKEEEDDKDMDMDKDGREILKIWSFKMMGCKITDRDLTKRFLKALVV
jgi:hypothetical protein